MDLWPFLGSNCQIITLSGFTESNFFEGLGSPLAVFFLLLALKKLKQMLTPWRQS